MKKIGLVILAAMAFIMGGVINAHQVSADTDPLHERLYRKDYIEFIIQIQVNIYLHLLVGRF